MTRSQKEMFTRSCTVIAPCFLNFFLKLFKTWFFSQIRVIGPRQSLSTPTRQRASECVEFNVTLDT